MQVYGNFEGTPAEKLRQVRAYVAEFVDDAGCSLSDDATAIHIRAQDFEGIWHEKVLSVELLPVEIVRHAVMRLGRATRSPDVISDWERWASAWQVIRTHGDRAVWFAERRIEHLTAEGERSGAVVWKDIRRRIAVLNADPTAWTGRA